MKMLYLIIISTLLLILNQPLKACPQLPTTSASFVVKNYQVYETIAFDASSSHDNDLVNGGNTPYWQWDFNYSPGAFNPCKTSVSPLVQWTYEQPGTHQVAVLYFDDDGQSNNLYVMTITVVSDNQQAQPPGQFSGDQMTVNLRFLIEGFFHPECDNTVEDEVTVLLYFSSDVTVENITNKKKATFDDQGYLSVSFQNIPSSTEFYIGIQHRNAMRTWSSVKFSPSAVINFDFTTSANQAFGHNMKLQGGKWCFISGDVDQDGYIGLFDLTLIDNDAFYMLEGTHLATDLDGDGLVSNVDLTICDNNAVYGAFECQPFFEPY